MQTINVRDVINKNIAMSTEDGNKLFEVLYAALKEKEKVHLSFANIDILISHFLNESIGRLYEKFANWEILDQAIEYTDIDKDDLDLLIDKVIPTAKVHYKDVKRSEKIEADILND
ncbi:MAG: STAS-like domain-containing protein [Sulfuricurvum sp.]